MTIPGLISLVIPAAMKTTSKTKMFNFADAKASVALEFYESNFSRFMQEIPKVFFRFGAYADVKACGERAGD